MTTNNGAGVVGSQVGLSAIKGVIPVAEGQAVLPIRCVLHDRTNDLITDIAPCGCRCRPDRPVCTIRIKYGEGEQGAIVDQAASGDSKDSPDFV